MKKVIEKYKKGIFVFTVINCFALLVNVFNLDIGNGVSNYLTSKDITRDEFWPFVTYSYDYTTHSATPVTTTHFNGIFYQYGIGEFLLYMGIMVAFLVYKSYIATPKVKVPST